MQDTFLTILTENFAHTFFLPVGQNMTFEAMYWFGKINTTEVLAYILGALAGCMVNWALGLGLAKLREMRTESFSDARYEKLHAYFRRYGIWLLPLYWAPCGALLVIAGGFFRVKGWQMLALAAIGAVLGLYVEFPAALA